jgi:DNA modification methylase
MVLYKGEAAVKIHIWPVSQLVPYCHQLRKNDHAVDRMMASIHEFGFKIPILALSNGEVIDGGLRLKAAQKLGLTEVPVVLCDEWSPAQVKAFRLMVNQSATWAEWDMELVALEIEGLKALDFDLALTGFKPLQIDELLLGKDETKSAEVDPQLPVHAVTRPGDLWECGPHRVLCGDATSEEEVNNLCGVYKPLLMVTDPPYGVDYDPNWRELAGLGRQRQTGTVANDDRADWTAAYLLFPGNVAYVWHAGIHASEVASGLESSGFRIRAQIIWAKQHFALGRGDYHWQHEPCWYAVREGEPANWCGDRTQSTLWEVRNLNPIGGNRAENATGHGTQKPLELMRRPILNNSARGDIVYDPFLGSGTTLIAAEETGRICYGLDIDGRYVDVIIRRWQTYTGKAALLFSTGRPFDEVAAARDLDRVPGPVEV